jgi:hypothetical protein
MEIEWTPLVTNATCVAGGAPQLSQAWSAMKPQ